MTLSIREAHATDWPLLWSILEPVYREGEVFCQPLDITAEQARRYWMEQPDKTFVCTRDEGTIIGAYFIRANQPGPGSHVGNCGYVVDSAARGLGAASAMCTHSQEMALEMGFRAMQFNFVISTNEVAVRLWKQHGFSIIGTLPGAFQHPKLGDVDVFVMFKQLPTASATA